MNNSQPLTSILIITYNQIDFIHETLQGALEQDYDNLEVVVADDASTDGTADVILEYAKKYPKRLIPLVGGSNLGITANSNRALRACKGKYIAFQGGDDVFLPGKIRAQVEWMESDENRVLCGHAVQVIRSNDKTEVRKVSESNGTGKGYIDYIKNIAEPFVTVSVMVRSACLPVYGFDERFPLVSDWKLWIDCLKENGEYGYIEGVYAKYRRHEENVTLLRGVECAEDNIKIYQLLSKEKTNIKATQLLNRKLAVSYLFLSILQLRKRDFILAFKSALVGLVTNPFSFIQMFSYLLKSRISRI